MNTYTNESNVQVKEKIARLMTDAGWLSAADAVELFKTSDLQHCFPDCRDKLVLIGNDGGEYMINRLMTKTKLAKVRHLSLIYLEYAGENDGYFTHHTQYFSPDDREGAVKAFYDRMKAPDPVYGVPASNKNLEELYRMQSGDLYYNSHYDYLDAILNFFWLQVFGKSADDMFCGGIVGAHGDKCYSYRDHWEEHGISFQHGALLFLLSYTNERGEWPRHEIDKWVIENYPKYYRKIIDAETLLIAQIGYTGPLPLEIDVQQESMEHPQKWTFAQYGQATAVIESETEVEAMKSWLEKKKKFPAV